MSIDLSDLLASSFFAEDVQNASEAIGRVLDAYEQTSHLGARPVEVVVPDAPDREWVRDRLVHPLAYFCESEGSTLPDCGGVIVALFVGRRLYGVTAKRALQWGSDVLGISMEQIRDEYGTHETGTAMR